MASKITVRELDSKMSDLHKYFEDQLTNFREEIDKVKTPDITENGREMSGLETIKNRFSFFEATIKNNIKDLQSQIDKLRSDSERINLKLDGIMQGDCKNNILIHGIDEKNGEDLYVDVKAIIENKLKIHLDKNEINLCYRYGKRPEVNNRCRPVLIKFIHGWKRSEVLKNKKLFKGTRLVCTEHISPLRYILFRTIRDRFGKDCWTRNGKIGFVYNGSVHYVTTREQMISICGVSEQASSLAGTAKHTNVSS